MFYGIQAGSKTVTQLWGRGVAHIYAFEPSPPRPPTCRKYSVAQSAERIQPTRPQPQPPSPSSVPIPPTPQRRRPDPFLLLAPQLSELRLSLLSLLESGHPALSEITRYYFLHPSKQIRPLIILLFSHATNGLGRQWDRKLWEATCEGAGGAKDELDRPLTRPDVLNDWNPSMPENTTNFCQTFSPKPGKPHRPAVPKYHQPLTAHPPTTTPAVFPAPTYVLPTQMRLAQIVEMMHTASLLHDDVIDSSPLRRGSPSAPTAFGNKLSILGGNFVLGRASAALSRLGDAEVTDLIASVISNLVEGEILQMKEMKMGEGEGEEEVVQPIPSVGGQRTGDAWRVYLQKTYLKTASLMAKGARAAVTLGGCKEGDIWREIAYAYGRNLGIAFQLVDDILDYESASTTLGKPGGADLQLGLATGPALYAWEEHPEMGELIHRKFQNSGDVERAKDYVVRSSALQRTRALAKVYADKANEVIERLPESEAKDALEVLTEKVIERKK